MIITENKQVSRLVEAKKMIQEAKELLKESGFAVISEGEYKDLKEKAELYKKMDKNFDKVVETYLEEKGLKAVEQDFEEKLIEEYDKKITKDIVIETLEEEGYIVLDNELIEKIDETLRKLGLTEEQIKSLFEKDDEKDNEEDSEGNAIDIDKEIENGEKEADEVEEECKKDKKEKNESIVNEEDNDDNKDNEDEEKSDDSDKDSDDDEENVDESIKEQLELTEKVFKNILTEQKIDEEIHDLKENTHIIDKIIP